MSQHKSQMKQTYINIFLQLTVWYLTCWRLCLPIRQCHVPYRWRHVLTETSSWASFCTDPGWSDQSDYQSADWRGAEKRHVHFRCITSGSLRSWFRLVRDQHHGPLHTAVVLTLYCIMVHGTRQWYLPCTASRAAAHDSGTNPVLHHGPLHTAVVLALYCVTGHCTRQWYSPCTASWSTAHSSGTCPVLRHGPLHTTVVLALYSATVRCTRQWYSPCIRSRSAAHDSGTHPVLHHGPLHTAVVLALYCVTVRCTRQWYSPCIRSRSAAHDSGTHPVFGDGAFDLLEPSEGAHADGDGVEVNDHDGDVSAQSVHVVQQQVYAVVTLCTSAQRYHTPSVYTLYNLHSTYTRSLHL